MGKVEVVVVDSEGAESESDAEPTGDLGYAYSVKVKRRPKKGWVGKLRWALDPRILYPHGCGVDEEATRRVLKSVGEFDLLWFCKLFTANMLRGWSWPRSVVDIDDVPSTYERAALQSGGSLGERLLTLNRILSWRRREKLLGERFNVLAVCSEADKRYLARVGVKEPVPVHVIPNGFERPPAEPVRRLTIPPRIGFTGVFDHTPNVEGVRWFLNECWPRIKREVPDARLRVAGRYSDGPLKPLGPDVDALGWVEDIDAEMATWSVMVVPIHLGAGTRIKIALGFSRKCPMVSTSLGAYGYDIRDGEEMFLADGPEPFAGACVQLIRRPEESARMAETAYRKFLENWTWEAIHPRIWAAAEDCLRRSGSGLPRSDTPSS
jgi:glycosyltransferase involved in cell wall biosynthesis